MPAGFTLDELFLPGVSPAFRSDAGWFTWRNLFLRIDRILKWWERHGSAQHPPEGHARAPSNGCSSASQHSDGLGAIYPPMMYAIMALDVLGYPPDHPARQEAVRQFDSLMVDDGAALLLPALLFAGLGYGHRRVRAGRIRRGAARRAARARPTGCSRRKSAARATGR